MKATLSFPNTEKIRVFALMLIMLSLCSLEHDLLADDTEKAQRLAEMEQAALSHAGDPKLGRNLFFDAQRTKCATCHKVGKEGGKVGPDLTHVGGKFDRSHLIESLLEPSLQIVEGYRTTSFVTTDGKILSGVVKERSDKVIKLLDVKGVQHELSASNIETESVSPVSIMPEGLATGLSTAEFTHLIAYLETLRADKLPKGAKVSGPIQLPEGFRVETIVTGLTGAVALEITNDNRIFLCEQTGALTVIQNDERLPKPLVTLPVEARWERGLIGVTVDPDFANNGYVYVCYVAKAPYPHHIVSRFTTQGNVAEPDSEQVLLEGDDQRKLGGNIPSGHQGGALHFGPEGCLYIGIGEQTAGLPAQKLDSFLGKILRINSNGSIPEDNPFINQTTGKYQAIWATGLRNPFTFAFNSENGRMFINDVGGRVEEINPGIAGANYGWPAVEHGPVKDAKYTGPVHTYRQSSIGGGAFVPMHSKWPSQYRGKYLFADFVQGWIHMIDPATADVVNANHAETFASGLRQPVDLRLSLDGSLYVLLRNAWVIDGKFQTGTSSLLKITYEE